MIDKNIPKKFVADKDERLLQPGDMTEAQNVTITERGEGSGSIVKTFKGAKESSPNVLHNELNLAEDVTVIGKIEDPQRNFVYFFVSDDVGNTLDSIIQHDPASDSYRTVLKSSWLNFSNTGFVKADVLNKDFKRDGTIQTVLYFTDNVNPPRKINVDRALDGDYDTYSNSELDIALGSMRAAPTIPPSFHFDTDSSVSINNFSKDTLQYATQIIYKDGEESALSPYSKLAVSLAASFGGIEETDYGVVQYAENVCSVSHNIDLDHPDIKAVRLLGRSGNSGAFFVIDEFDPTTTVKRDLYGSNIIVYDPDNGEYKFYNDILGKVIPDNTANKLFDNVPLKAEGQSITAGRLMYSNYTEGYANASLDSSDYTITPIYSAEGSALSTFATDSDASAMFSTSGLDVKVDLDQAVNINGSTVFPAGTEVLLEFAFYPNFTADVTSPGNLMVISATGYSAGAPPADLTLNVNGLTTGSAEGTNKKVKLSMVTTKVNSTPDELADDIQSNLDSIEFTVKYNSLSGINVTGDLTTTMSLASLILTFRFGENDTATGDVVEFKPRLTGAELITPILASTGSYSSVQIHPGDVLGVDGDNQNEVNYSAITNTIASESVSIKSFAGVPTFKQGATHSFGIVFYDKYGRSGFVNELGSVYAKAPHERATPAFGPVSMQFDLSSTDLTSQIPSWADSYQIVYAGSSVSDVFQYTVGGAYPRYLTEESGSNHLLDKSVHNIYVSLKTLDQYRRDKEVHRNYSFTEGDKLRILARRNQTDTGWVYPSSEDGDIMEFDVVGVETVDSDPIRKNKDPFTGTDETHPQKGTFVILSAPTVEATSGNTGSVNKYDSHDWNHITGEDYKGGDSVTQNNKWNWNCLVEIVTPKKATAEKLYYEIGERKKIRVYKSGVGNLGPAFTVNGGDVHYRPIAAKTPVYNSGWVTGLDNENPEDWEYTVRYIEDSSVSDMFSSKSWDRGRAHSVFRNAAQVTRYNSVTYSDTYADDTAVLNLSSFNPSLINFFDLPSEYGACKYIGNISDKLVTVQENKVSLVGVNKDVIETGSQSGLISLSTSVLNNIAPFGGDYGTQNAESVLVRDGSVYFADKSRRAIVRASLKGMEILSDIDIKSYVESQFGLWSAESGSRIVSGYDPDDNVYYITLEPAGSFNGLTLGYNLGGFWQGTYTFYPTCYAAINDNFIICKYNETLSGSHDLIFTFKTEMSNQFINQLTRETSKVTVVSNINPSMVKAYKSVSIEGDSAWTTTLESSSGQTTASLSFIEKEDAFYADVTGDTSSNSNSQYIGVGSVASEVSGVVTLSTSLNGIYVPIGYTLYKSDGAGGFTTLTETVSSVDVGAKTISHTGGILSLSAGDELFVASNQSLNGDQIRGHYCKIKCSLTPSSTNREELYSINANFVNSKANHSRN